MAEVFDWFIRFLHIFSGVMWVGGVALWGMVIAPSLQKRTPAQAAGPVMGVIAPRVARYFGIAGVVTVITGLWTMGLIVGFDQISTAFKDTAWGMTLGAAFFIALIMLVVAFVVIIPAVNKMIALAKNAQGDTPPAEMGGLQKRVMMGGMANLALGIVALGLMAWATHIGVH